PTYYYYVMILVPVLFFASKLEQIPRALGLVLILVFGMLGNAGHEHWGRTYEQFFMLSVAAMVLMLYMMVVAALPRRAMPEGAVGSEAPEVSHRSALRMAAAVLFACT